LKVSGIHTVGVTFLSRNVHNLVGPAVGIDLGTTNSCVSVMESKTSHVGINTGTPADMTAYGAFTHI